MHKVDLPTDTSGGVFKSLADVGKQDAAASAHYPVLSNRFILLSDTVKENETTDKENATDVDDAIARLKEVFDKILKEEEKRGWFR